MSAIDPAELEALAALDLARGDIAPIPTDGSQWRDGELHTWASARQVHACAEQVLSRHGIEVEFRGSTIKASFVSVQFGWRWIDTQRSDDGKSPGSWRADPTTIEMMLDTRDLGPTAASRAVVTSARKLFVEQLLEAVVEDGTEIDLSRSCDRTRRALYHEGRQLLRDYCKRFKVEPGLTIATLLDWAPEGITPTYEMLTPISISMLCTRLLCGLGPEYSVQFLPGEAPANMDDLPASMGGAA